MGGLGDPELAQMIFEELCRRGLAKQSEDGASIPLHPLVRNLFLVLLGQILREGGPGLGLELSPATDSPKIQAALVQLLGLPTPQPSAGRVVTVDLELVGRIWKPFRLTRWSSSEQSTERSFGPTLGVYARWCVGMAGDSSDEDASVLADRLEEIREAGEALRWAASKMCRQPRLIWPPSFGHGRRCLRVCVLG